MKVENMTSSKGNKVANQFLIKGAHHYGVIGCFFQSYSTIIAFRPSNGNAITLDRDKWDYHQVRHDNELLFGGSANQCFEWLLKHQSCSVNHACKHEGYSITVSRTTAKYRNQFLDESTKETQAKIDSGEYILTDLN